MSLRIWLPLNESLQNMGPAAIISTAGSTNYSDGKVTAKCLSGCSWVEWRTNSTIIPATTNLQYSFGAWIKNINQTEAANHWVFALGEGDGKCKGLWTGNGATSALHFAYSGTGQDVTCNINIQDGKWHHVFFIVDKTTVTLWVDGQKQGTTMLNETGKVACNVEVIKLYTPFYSVNDFKFYDHVLSAKEVKELSKGLSLHYKFNFEDLYQPVEYIMSRGGQYIDTEFTADQNSSVEVKFSSTSYKNGAIKVFGAGGSNWMDRTFELYSWSNVDDGTSAPRLQFNCNPGAYDPAIGLFLDNVPLESSAKHVIITAYFNKNNTNACSIITSTGQSSTGTLPATSSFDCPNTLTLFAINRDTLQASTANVKIFYCKIWDNGKLVRNFIPCVRKTDYRAGLYDFITNKFYVNATSTGDFDTPYFNGQLAYTTVDYLQANGNQVIRTEVSGNNQKLAFDLTYAASQKAQMCLFSARTDATNGISAWTDDGYAQYGAASDRHAGTINDTNTHTISLSKNYFIFDHTYISDFNGGTNLSNNTIKLFQAEVDDTRTFKGKIFSFKIYDNGVLIKNFIPSVRKVDSMPGLYDLVDGWFYTNVGTGNFTFPTITITKDTRDSVSYYDPINHNNTSISDDTIYGTKSLSFSGNESYLRLATEVLTGGAYTVSIWAKTASNATQCLFCDREATGSGPAIFLWQGNKVRFDADNINCAADFVYNDNKWHLYTCIYNGNQRLIYIDGIKKTAYNTTSIGGRGGVLAIGGSYTGPNNPDSPSDVPVNNWLTGAIADWRLYNTALSEADVTELYNLKESIDNKGNLYCNTFDENINSTGFTKTCIVASNSLLEGSSTASINTSKISVNQLEEIY